MSDNLNKEKRKRNKEEKDFNLLENVQQTQNEDKENTEKEQQNNNNSKEIIITEEIEINENSENDKLSKSINELLLNKEFASSVVKKKKSKIITDFHYVTFQNSFGENTCFINVILHLLHFIPELNGYLTSLSKIYDMDKDSREKNSNIDLNKNTNKFLVLLGRILSKYQEIINNKKKNKVTTIKTLNMRKVLENVSSNKFALNSIADPIELFSFILDILNEYLNENLHKSFHLELIEEFFCKKNNCQISIKNKYDKDNFIYHIYIDEILKYIEDENIKVEQYKNNLFKYSYLMFLSENSKLCEKCKGKMEHNLICMNEPEFLLINCVWKESNPIVDDVITFLFLISLKDELKNLFVYSNKKAQYYLLGFILYSFSLSHYIITMYNKEKNIFVLFDDEAAKEYNNLSDLIIDITVNKLRHNKKAYFYPVMLIFTSEKIYDNKIIKFNSLNNTDYSNIIKKCNEAIYEYEMQNNLSEQEKLDNYQAYVEKQIELENSIKKKKNKNKYKNSKNKHEEDIYNNNIENEIDLVIKDMNKTQINNEKEENNKEKNEKYKDSTNIDNNILDLLQTGEKKGNKQIKNKDREKNEKPKPLYFYTYNNENNRDIEKKEKKSFFKVDKNIKLDGKKKNNEKKKNNISEKNNDILISKSLEKNSYKEEKDEKYLNIEYTDYNNNAKSNIDNIHNKNKNQEKNKENNDNKDKIIENIFVVNRSQINRKKSKENNKSMKKNKSFNNEDKNKDDKSSSKLIGRKTKLNKNKKD